ncbi:MAG: diphosphomevalonate decarboxylase [Bacteroidota bacterium]
MPEIIIVSLNQFYSSFVQNALNQEGIITWQSPSNIALIKYWGKFGIQLPKNPSLSFGLSESFTQTSVKYSIKKEDKSKRIFRFDGNENEAFAKKIFQFLDDLDLFFPFLKQVDLQIESKNSFPHSAGIASSASSMSALALCLCSLEQELTGGLKEESDFYQKASFIARLGSGSACRSVYKGFSIWGDYTEITECSNEYAIDINYEIHPFFRGLNDSILIVNEKEKSVSSRAGHALMEKHPYAEARIIQSRKNLNGLLAAMSKADTAAFIQIVENEALSLHALMLSSNPWYSLLHPNTLTILDKIRNFRNTSGLFVCFTLDAGPNVHLIYHEENKTQIQEFIDEELLIHCEGQKVIYDKIGDGPKRLN